MRDKRGEGRRALLGRLRSAAHPALSTASVPAFSALLLAAFLLLLCPVVVLGYTLIPGQVHSLPARIQVNYSAPVTITAATLYSVLTGEQLAAYGPGNFTSPTNDNRTYLIAIDEGITQGDYDLVIAKEDANPPNTPLAEDAIRFQYWPLDAVLNVHLASLRRLRPSGDAPLETGFATSKPYTASFTTTKPAWCRYSAFKETDSRFMTVFPVTGTPAAPVTLHTATSLTSAETDPFIVWCNTTAGVAIRKSFVLGYENASPSFTVTASPPMIVDHLNRRTLLAVQSDQKVYCEATGADGAITGLAPAGLTILDAGAYNYTPSGTIVFAETPTAPVTREYLVRCTNRAGLSRTERLNITIDLQRTPALIRVSPEAYTKETEPTLAVQAVKGGIPVEAGSCRLANNTQLSTTDRYAYNLPLGPLADGRHEYTATCVIAGGVSVTGTVGFTIDTGVPQGHALAAPATVCDGEPLTANITLPVEYAVDPTFAGYAYNLTYTSGTAVLASGLTGDILITSDVETLPGKTYRWHVRATDLAGNKGAEMTDDTQVLNGSDDRCDTAPPIGSLNVTASTQGIAVQILCDDDRGCDADADYGVSPPGKDCDRNGTAAINATIRFTGNTTFCYAVYDRNGNRATGLELLLLERSGVFGNLCLNGVRDATSGEAGIDCGGTCPDACQAGSNCTTASDCTSRFCDPATGTCGTAACDDAERNGYETDVDCGGSVCLACADGKGCVLNADCASSSCNATTATCMVPSTVVEEGCLSDGECGSGKACSAGSCVTKPLAGACDDVACTPGTHCDAGSCVVDTIIAPDGFSTLGLALLIVGLLLMAGTGYWLVSLRKGRPAPYEEEPAYAPPPQELTPEQRLALLRQRQEQLESLQQRQAQATQAQATKEVRRRTVVKKLDVERPPAEQPAEQQAPPPSEEADAAADDGFINVEELQRTTQETRPAKPKKPSKGVFSELDNVIEKEGTDAPKTARKKGAGGKG